MTENELSDPDTDRLGDRLSELFADLRPDAALEDRTVRHLRAEPRRKQVALTGWPRKLTIGLAASVGLGLMGAAATQFLDMPLPGYVLRSPGSQAKPQDVSLVDGSESMFGTHRWKMGARDFGTTDFSADFDGRVVAGEQVHEPKYSESKPSAPVNDKDNKKAYGNYFGLGDLEKSAGKSSEGAHYRFFAPGEGKVALGVEGKMGEAVTEAFLKTPEEILRKQNTELGEKNMFLKTQSAQKPEVAYAGLPVILAGQEPGKPVVANPAANEFRKIIIKSGDVEFEVDSFDAAREVVTQLVEKIKDAKGQQAGFIATVNSDKLPNGKVKGAIVVRVPPDKLDPFVLDLRRELGKTGELKGQRIGSQDVTKQYTDLESRLKAANTMKERLLKIIAEGKGDIKTLLEAEKELGVWTTKIEEMEGERRYYDNLVGLSTLTITLVEKEMRLAAGLTECERVQAGVEVEDVETAYREVLKAVSDAKGRITKAELKQLAAGQFNAALHFEVPPEAAGPVRDRLRQLGRVARLEIDRIQTADGGPVPKDAKIKRGDTTFLLQLYNLANIQPRESATLQIATPDVAASYRKLQDAVALAKGRVLAANLNEQDPHNVTAQFDFEIKRSDEGALRAAFAAVGETLSRVVSRAPETDAVTDTKLLFRTTLFNITRLKPRETNALTVEVADVDAALNAVNAQATEAKARTLDQQTTRDAAGKVTAKLTLAVPLAAATGLMEKCKATGAVRGQASHRDPQAPDGPAATARIDLTLTNDEPLVGSDEGFWAQVRKGLSLSANVLLKTVTFVIVGLCVVLPFALVGIGGYKLFRRIFGGRDAKPATAG